MILKRDSDVLKICLEILLKYGWLCLLYLSEGEGWSSNTPQMQWILQFHGPHFEKQTNGSRPMSLMDPSKMQFLAFDLNGAKAKSGPPYLRGTDSTVIHWKEPSGPRKCPCTYFGDQNRLLEKRETFMHSHGGGSTMYTWDVPVQSLSLSFCNILVPVQSADKHLLSR